MLKGSPQHLMQNQLLKLLQQVMKGILSVVDVKMTFALSFCAACVITSAYAFAVNAANLSFYFNTLSTPYFDNSETSSALTVTAVVVPKDSATFFCIRG
jgi:hypothetical protein